MRCRKCGCEAPEGILRCFICDTKQHGGNRKSKADVSADPNSSNDKSSKKKSATGILAIINVVILIPYNVVFRAPEILVTAREITDDESTMLGFYLIKIFILMIVSSILHIVGLISSNKQGISMKGHVLGIVGAVITMASLTVFSFISIVLFILAAIFIFKQPNVVPLVREERACGKVISSKIEKLPQKTITKKSLFWYIIKWNLIIVVLFAIILIFILSWITNSQPADFDDLFDRILLLVLYFFIFIFGLWYTFTPAGRIFKSIRKQEKVLGFSFNNEMEEQGKQRLPVQSSQWFISRHAAYHRDFVVEVKNLKGNYNSNYARVIIMGKDGTKNWLQNDAFTFVEWVKKNNRKIGETDTSPKIRLDRLYEWPQPKGSIVSTFFVGLLAALLMWFTVDHVYTLVKRESLLQDITRTTAIVTRADAGRGRNASPHIRVSFEANGRFHNDRIRVPITSVDVGDEIEIYFANEDNCVIMAVDRDISRRHYIYNISIGSIFTLITGSALVRNIYALVINRKIRKNGEDWWSEKIEKSQRKSKQNYEHLNEEYIENAKALLLKHESRILNKTEFPNQYLRESKKGGKVLVLYESEKLDVTVMRFYGRTELVINGFIYEEKFGKREKSYELGAEVLGSKVKFINLHTGWLCYVYILIDDEIVAVHSRQ